MKLSTDKKLDKKEREAWARYKAHEISYEELLIQLGHIKAFRLLLSQNLIKDKEAA